MGSQGRIQGQRRREIRSASGDDLGEQGRAPGPRVPAASSCARAPAGRGAGRGYLAAKSPAANEPGAARAIFSSSDAGRLIAPAGSRQAAMETLGAAAERGSGPRGLPLVPPPPPPPPPRASAAQLCARPAPHDGGDPGGGLSLPRAPVALVSSSGIWPRRVNGRPRVTRLARGRAGT